MDKRHPSINDLPVDSVLGFAAMVLFAVSFGMAVGGDYLPAAEIALAAGGLAVGALLWHRGRS